MAALKTLEGRRSLEKLETVAGRTADSGAFTDLPCFRCGICCRRYQPRIGLLEARTIADGLGLSWEEFAASYLDSRYFGEERFLLRQHNGACIFLEQLDERLALCKIHPFKPSACRDWVPSLFRRECQTALAQFWGLSVDNQGNLLGSDDALNRFYSFLRTLS